MTIKKLSLIQRLWLLLLLLVVLSIGGALIANMLNARRYLEQQLTTQSADTANSLALMMTQRKADPVLAQTLLNATFDQGNYAEVRWEDPMGRAIIHLTNEGSAGDVPSWFTRLLPLTSASGVAQVSNGWLQAGRIVVVAQPGDAYRSLWRGAIQTVSWLLALGLVAALLGALDIRRLRRQLGTMVGQAQAISEQRFVQIPIPAIPELAEVAGAMNRMVERLKNFLAALQDETEQLRKEVLTDASTGLPNREAFNQVFADMLEPQDDPLVGYLLLIRVAGLAELNQRLGGRKTDALLKRIADDMQARSHMQRGWMVTRLRGADFAMLCPEVSRDEAIALTEELCGLWPLYQSMDLTDQIGVGHIGLTSFQSGDTINLVLARANRSLTMAESQPLNSWRMSDVNSDGLHQSSDLDWKMLFEQIGQDETLQLRWYPVCTPDGQTIWHEGMLFRPHTGAMPHMSALRLVSHALRLGAVHQLDLSALALALEKGPQGRLAVNMSPASLAHPDFLANVMRLLQHYPERHINFEFHEIGLEEHWDGFIAFSRAVRPAGHQLAVEVVGQNMGLVARTHEASIAYLVLDSSLTNGIQEDSGRSALLRGLLKMASLMGVQLEAKGVHLPDDLQTLIDSGVHYLTGPAIKETAS